MKTESTILFFTIGLFSLGFTLNFAHAEITPNNAFLLEGTGFGVNEELIQFSEIDFAFTTGDQSGSRANLVVEDGFVNIGDDDFIVTDITGTVLRDGKFLRISGVVENPVGGEATISYFGRLIEDSQEGSIYSFTGRINLEDESYKMVYTSKISSLVVLTTKTSTTLEPSAYSIPVPSQIFTLPKIFEDVSNPVPLSILCDAVSSLIQVIVVPGSIAILSIVYGPALIGCPTSI